MYRNGLIEFQLSWDYRPMNFEDTVSPMNIIPVISHEDLKEDFPFDTDYDSSDSDLCNDLGVKNFPQYQNGECTPLFDFNPLDFTKDVLSNSFNEPSSECPSVVDSQGSQSMASSKLKIKKEFQNTIDSKGKLANNSFNFNQFAKDSNLSSVVPPHIMSLLAEKFSEYNSQLLNVDSLKKFEDEEPNNLKLMQLGKRKFEDLKLNDLHHLKIRRLDSNIDCESSNSTDTPPTPFDDMIPKNVLIKNTSCSRDYIKSEYNQYHENMMTSDCLKLKKEYQIALKENHQSVVYFDNKERDENIYESNSIKPNNLKKNLSKKVKVTFRPARKTNASYIESQSFPEFLLSAPYKYLMKVTYCSEHHTRTSPTVYFMDEDGESLSDRFSISEVKSLTGKDHDGYSQTFMIQMKTTSFETKKQFYISIPSLDYKSRLFSIKARYSKGEIVSWPSSQDY